MGLLALHVGWAQQKTISGTVNDETGLPLPGATVVVEGTNRGVATGASQADINTAYLEGIKSSFSELGLTEDDYNAYIAQANVNPTTISLTEVMTQKWFALYTNPESFTDWRRTNIPSLTPNNGVAIPTRWLYPQSETELNPNSPNALLTDKVDWDTN